jgi:hypothetical protein
MNPVKTLFVVWQDSASRRFFPVGRLSKVALPSGTTFEFVYTRGVCQASGFGFKPFMAFPELSTSYRSERLSPFFENRLVPPTRTDFGGFVKSLGLDPATATEMDILARSGGRRVTDSVELFAAPEVALPDECLIYFFLSHGLSHMLACAQERVGSLPSGDRLFIVHDLQNPVDPQALLLRTADYCCVGFLPRYLASDTWRLLNSGAEVQVLVEQLNPPPAPVQQRLLCRMRASKIHEFIPCTDEIYQPYSGLPARTPAMRA